MSLLEQAWIYDHLCLQNFMGQCAGPSFSTVIVLEISMLRQQQLEMLVVSQHVSCLFWHLQARNLPAQVFLLIFVVNMLSTGFGILKAIFCHV